MANRAKGWNIRNHRKQLKANKLKKQEELEKRDAACGFKKSERLGAKYVEA